MWLMFTTRSYAVRVAIFSTGSKFKILELHTLTQAAPFLCTLDCNVNLASEICLDTETWEHKTFLQLQEYGDALRTHAEPPKSTNFFFQPILNALSTDLQQQLDEVTAMIVTAEALIGNARRYCVLTACCTVEWRCSEGLLVASF